jgi:diguanylate cyclase (GGDEF)-like protein/PAS domain S-box-containing protein
MVYGIPEGMAGRIFDLANELFCVTDAHGVVLEANPAAAGLLAAPADLRGLALPGLVLHEDEATAVSLFRDRNDAHPRASAVLRMLTAGGRLLRLRWSVTRDPESDHRYAVAWDVTDRHLTGIRYRAATEASPTALVMVDAAGRIVMANRATLRLVQYGRSELVGQHVEVLVPEAARALHPEHRAGFQRRPSVRPMGRGRDLAVRRHDGALVPVEIGLNPVNVDGEVHTVVSLVDLTERKLADEKIRKLAEELTGANRALELLAGTDELTGLWNRRRFFEESERLLKLLQQTGNIFSLILVDVDDFKTFNDRFGHVAGDEILKRVALAMGEVRLGSDYTARYGGEEFVIGLPATGAARARAVAERLRVAVAQIVWEGVPITISAGVATLTDLGARGTPTEPLLMRLIEAADRALYQSKASGKNRVT